MPKRNRENTIDECCPICGVIFRGKAVIKQSGGPYAMGKRCPNGHWSAATSLRNNRVRIHVLAHGPQENKERHAMSTSNTPGKMDIDEWDAAIEVCKKVVSSAAAEGNTDVKTAMLIYDRLEALKRQPSEPKTMPQEYFDLSQEIGADHLMPGTEVHQQPEIKRLPRIRIIGDSIFTIPRLMPNESAVRAIIPAPAAEPATPPIERLATSARILSDPIYNTMSGVRVMGVNMKLTDDSDCVYGVVDEQDIVTRLRENADLDEMEDCNPAVVTMEREAADEIERLRAALSSTPSEPNKRDLVDAERYRFLRDPQTDVALVIDKRTEWIPPDESVAGVGGYWMYEYRAGDELDAAIDVARAAKEKANG